MISLILVLGKQESLPDAVSHTLLQQGYEIGVIRNLDQVVEVIAGKQLDLLILDATTPRVPALKLIRQFKAQRVESPILLLASHASLQAGHLATHTLVQPFTSQELQAAIGALIPLDLHDLLTVGPLNLNVNRRELSGPRGVQRLTPKVCQLLEVLMRRAGQTVSRAELMSTIWNTKYLGDTRTLDVHIRWLRERIEVDPSHPIYLLTERGIGYRLVDMMNGQDPE